MSHGRLGKGWTPVASRKFWMPLQAPYRLREARRPLRYSNTGMG